AGRRQRGGEAVHGQRIEQVALHHLQWIAYRGEVVGPVPAREQGQVVQQGGAGGRVDAERIEAACQAWGSGGGQETVVHRGAVCREATGAAARQASAP